MTQANTTQVQPVNWDTISYLHSNPNYSYAERRYICGDWGALEYIGKARDRQKTNRELQLLPFLALCEGGGGWGRGEGGGGEYMGEREGWGSIHETGRNVSQKGWADRAPHGSEAQEFVVLTLCMYISTTEDGFKSWRDVTAILLKLFHSAGLSPWGAGHMAGGQCVPHLALTAAFHVGGTELVRQDHTQCPHWRFSA